MSKIDPKLMEILVCPLSKKALVQKDDELICYESEVAYPIRDGIPIMLPEEARKLSKDELKE
tara:strand:+ start:171 stop:356 length:186 start_codon:yes stop_codon:yes gene_type:complete